jgi:WD40 repeat protein
MSGRVLGLDQVCLQIPPTGPRRSLRATPPPPPAPAPREEVEPADEAELPIDDPERYEQVAEQGRGGLGRVVRAVDKRLQLLPHIIAIADAVGYAHSEGVIHRDLKPSNVIVGSFGETFVIDWGLARDRKCPIPDAPAEMAVATGSGVSTVSGKIVGTPAYMAPEQARGEPVDERADVYAIGAVLYELLAGKAPHADDTPQSALDRVIAGPPEPLAQAAPGAPTELADIVAKAMARVPADRHPNASALAEDLRRFSTGKLVSAHAYTPWQIVGKKLKQHRGGVVVAVASAIALAAIGVESFRTVVAERDVARSQRVRAEEAEQSEKARRAELVLVQAQTSLREDRTAALAWLKQHPVHREDAEKVVDVIDEAIALGAARHVFRPNDWVFDAQFTPDGKTIVAAVRDGIVRAYDVDTGAMREIGRAPSAPWALAVSPDGKLAVTGGVTGEVIAWPIAGGKAKILSERGRMVASLTFDGTGTRVLVERDTGPAEIDAIDGTSDRVGGSSVLKVSIAHADWTKRIAQIAPNQLATPDGQSVIVQTERYIDFFKLSPKGDSLIVHDGETVWIAPLGGPLVKLAPYDGLLTDATWSPDGKTVALVGHRADWLLADLATRTAREYRGHSDAIYSAVFTADGTSVLTASDDGSARLWNLADASSVPLAGHRDDVDHARFSPDEHLARDGTKVYSASFDGTLRVWDLATGKSTALVEGDAPVRGFAVAADGRIAAQVGDTAVMIHADGTSETLGSGPTWCGTKAEFDRVRDRLILRRCDNGLTLVDGKRVVDLPTDGYAISRLAVSPDGSQIAAAMGDRSVRVWSENGTVLHKLKGHSDLVLDVAFSPDGSAVASSSYDRTVRVWQLANERHRVLRGHIGPVERVAWRSPHELVSASLDGTLRLWAAPSTDLPTQADITARLEAATTARIDEHNFPTTL